MKPRRAVKANTMKISQKIMLQNHSSKILLVVIKTMLNEKKVPCIPSIFHDNKFVTDFSKKADFFLFLQNSAQILKTTVFSLTIFLILLFSSTIPITDQYLANLEFTKDGIKRIISKFDPNKAHGHDMISIRMLIMSGDAITCFQNIQKLLKM